MSVIQRYSRSGLLPHGRHNRLIDQVNRLTDADTIPPHLPPHPSEFWRRFELTETLTPGGTAEAGLLLWNGYTEAWERLDDASAQFTVYDDLGSRRGRAAVESDIGDGQTDGSRGMAQWDFSRGVWRIAELQPIVQMIHCQATQTTSGDTCTVDAVAIMGPPGGLFLTEVTSVGNHHGWEITDDEKFTAAWDEEDEGFAAIQKDCPA